MGVTKKILKSSLMIYMSVIYLFFHKLFFFLQNFNFYASYRHIMNFFVVAKASLEILISQKRSNYRSEDDESQIMYRVMVF